MINIAIEGMDGVGKSTLCTNLSKHISSISGLHAPVIRQPNDIIQGLRSCAKHPNVAVPRLDRIDSIEAIDLDRLRKGEAACMEATTLLMMGGMAATSEFIAKLDAELSRVSRSLVVIHDRSLLSTLVYQAIARGHVHMIDPILATASTFCRQRYDITFVLTGRTNKIQQQVVSDCPFDKNIDVIAEGYAHYADIIRKVASVDMQDVFYRTFPNIVEINTEHVDANQTLERALECLRNHYPFLHRTSQSQPSS